MENCSKFEEVSLLEKQIEKRDATFANTISMFDSIRFAVKSVKEFQEGTFGPTPDGKNVIIKTLVKHGAILYNEAEVFSLSIRNPNGRPMLQFD